MSVAHDGTSLQIKTRLTADAEFRPYVPSVTAVQFPEVRCDGVLRLKRADGSVFAHVAEVSVTDFGELMVDTLPVSQSVNVDKLFNDVPAGQYVLSFDVVSSGHGRSSVSVSQGSVVIGKYADFEMTEIGRNGIRHFKHADQFVSIEDGKLKSKGAMDLPGLLLAGRVNSTGSYVTLWGQKALPNVLAERVTGEVGMYKVPHSIGHIDYSVTITPVESGMTIIPTVGNCFVDCFIVLFRNTSGARVNTGFHFAVHGHN